MRTRERLWTAVCLGFLAASLGVRRAGANPFVCRTDTAREPNEVVVPFATAEEPRVDVPPEVPESRRYGATFGLWAGQRRAHLVGLNAALARDGFAPLPSIEIVGGLDVDVMLGRARGGLSLGAGGHTVRNAATGVELSMWLTDIGLTAGYDVLRYEYLTLFASTGILLSELRMDGRTQGFTLFQSQLRSWERGKVKWSHRVLPLELGAEYLVPLGSASPGERWVLQLGTRLGWLHQLGGSWELDDEDHRSISGPPINLSGPRGRLVLGLGGIATR